MPLVYFSIPGNKNINFKYKRTLSDNKTKEYTLEIHYDYLKLPVTKRIEIYSPQIESYWSLIPSAKNLLSDIAEKFKNYGDNYDIDNIGGIVPNTPHSLSVLQVLYFNEDDAYMTNFFVQNLVNNTNNTTFTFTLHHVMDARTYPHSKHDSKHPDFSHKHHYHVNANKDETIYKVPQSSNFSLGRWSLELYRDCNDSNNDCHRP